MDNTEAGSNMLLRTRFFSGAIPPTPRNIEKVTEIEELISLFRHQTLDSPKLTLLHKTLKAARLAMADRVVLNHTNTECNPENAESRPQRRSHCYHFHSRYWYPHPLVYNVRKSCLPCILFVSAVPQRGPAQSSDRHLDSVIYPRLRAR